MGLLLRTLRRPRIRYYRGPGQSMHPEGPGLSLGIFHCDVRSQRPSRPPHPASITSRARCRSTSITTSLRPPCPSGKTALRTSESAHDEPALAPGTAHKRFRCTRCLTVRSKGRPCAHVKVDKNDTEYGIDFIELEQAARPRPEGREHAITTVQKPGDGVADDAARRGHGRGCEHRVQDGLPFAGTWSSPARSALITPALTLPGAGPVVHQIFFISDQGGWRHRLQFRCAMTLTDFAMSRT